MTCPREAGSALAKRWVSLVHDRRGVSCGTYVFVRSVLCAISIAPWCRYIREMFVEAPYRMTKTHILSMFCVFETDKQRRRSLSASQSACPNEFVTFSLPEHETEGIHGELSSTRIANSCALHSQISVTGSALRRQINDRVWGGEQGYTEDAEAWRRGDDGLRGHPRKRWHGVHYKRA